MTRIRYAPGAGTLGFCLLTLLLLGFVIPGTVFAGHKLVESQCYDCHVVGGSLADVVDQSHLIRITPDMTEIINNTATWNFGNPLPCIYCHDDAPRTVRENMMGVKGHFTSASLSKHPVDPYSSKSTGDADGGTLDCVDCHDVTVVPYVDPTAPWSALSPAIHDTNTAAVGWTPQHGNINANITYMDHTGGSAGDPSNAGGNTFCTNQCHDGLPGTGFDADQAYHQFNNPIVSLENGSNFLTVSQIEGCLNEAGTGAGCHAVHNARNNTDLITAARWMSTTPIGKGDCGSCHVFDDASTSSPIPRGSSDFYARGHGQFALGCLNCHNSSIPHFQADGTPATGDSAGRLNFVLDNTPSRLSSPAKSVLSVCTTSSCHDGYLAHTSPLDVGCLDCHDPHGYGLGGAGGNIKMMRESAPVASPASTTLQYQNTGEWFNSAVSTGYTFWACDDSDCHPNSINAIMDTNAGNPVPHSGGTGIRGACDSCHTHTGGTYSWEDDCSNCHGTQNTNSYPDSGAQNGNSWPNRSGKHDTHVLAIANANGWSTTKHETCIWCHPTGRHSGDQAALPADLVDGSTTHFRTITGTLDSGESVAQNGTNGTVSCSGVDCHYNNTMSPTDWYGAAVVGCDYCHAYDTAYDAGDLPVAHDLHVDEAASGGYDFACTTCHDTAGYTASHQDGASDNSIAFGGTAATAWTGAAYNSGSMQCTNLYCHGAVPPQPAQWDSAGSVVCGTCHGDPADNGRPDGIDEPAGGSHLTGGHQTTCGTCHTHNGGNAIEHVDGPFSPGNADAQVSTAGSGINAFSYGAGYFTDSPDPDGYEYSDQASCTPTCHGQLDWGGTGGSCDTCHGVSGTTAETNDWAWNGTTATINLDEYNNAGHGSTNGGAVSGTGTPVGCLDCHSESVPHNSASNPFRLDTSTYAANDINGFCGDTSAGCHANFSAISNHDSTVITNDKRTWHFTPKCVDCHDPHGDNNNRSTSGGTYNAKFIHDDLFDGGSDQYGVPAAQDTDYAGFDGTEAIGADNWAEGSGDGWDGLCQECHTQTVAFQDDTSDNISPHSANSGCVSCHPHDAGFEAGGCDGCHGSVGINFYPDSSGYALSIYEDREGAHYEHIIAIANANGGIESNDGTSCDWCHPNPGGTRPGTAEAAHSDDFQADSTADVHRDGRSGATATDFKTMSGGNDPDGAYSPSAWTCTNIDCHTNVDTPDWYGIAGPTSVPLTYGVLAGGSTTLSVQEGGTFTLTATIDDSGGGAHAISTAEYFVDTVGADGSGTAMSATDGTFDSNTEAVRALNISTTGWTVGDHWLYVHGQDVADGWGNTAAVKVTIYDADTVTMTYTQAMAVGSTLYPGDRDDFLTLHFNVNTNGDSQATIDRIRIDEIGTTVDADIASVEIYDDSGGSAGMWDTTGDNLIGSGTFSGSTVDIDIVDQALINGSQTDLHVAYLIAAGANTSSYTGARLSNQGYITLQSPDSMAAFSTIVSNTANIRSPLGGVCYAGYGYTAYPGSWTDAGSSGSTTYIDKGLPAPNDCDLTTYCYYSNNTASGNIAVFTATWSGTSVTNTGNEISYTNAGGVTGGWDCNTGPTLSILQGEYIGFYETGTQAISRMNGTNGGYLYLSGDQTPPTTNWTGTDAAANSYSFFGTGTTASPPPTNPPATTNVLVDLTSEVTVAQGDTVNLTATVSDADGNTVNAAEYFLDTVGGDGTGTSMSATDGTFNSSSEGVRTLNISTSGWSAGQHRLYVHGQDASDGWGATSYAIVNITVPGTLTVTGNDLAPAGVDKGATAAMLRLDAVMDTGDTTATAFTVDLIGTGTVSAVSQVYVYLDDGNDSFEAGTDVAIGSAAFATDPVGVTVSGTAIDTGGESFFVVYAIDASATSGSTVGANITGISIDAADAVSGLPTSSGTTTINTPGGITCGDCHAIPNGSGAHDVHADGDTDYSDCYDCHTDNSGLGYNTSPEGTHNNSAVTFSSISYSGGTDGTCSIWCHYGTTPNWSSGSTDCDTCHGYPPVGANGTMDHMSTNRTRSPQSGSSTNAGFFNAHTQCSVCHGVSGNTDWDVAGTSSFASTVDNTPLGDVYVSSMHADGLIQINGAGGANAPFVDENTDYRAGTGGCVQACHTAPNDEWRYASAPTGNSLDLREFGAGGACDACHGGTTGTDANGYWPDAGSRGSADTAGSQDEIGAHLVHIQSLAMSRWGESISTLLTDNGNGTADSKQQTLCEYCHPSRTTDTTGSGDHFGGDDAETTINNGNYSWTGEFPFTDGTDVNDNGDFGNYTGYTCANVDCHNNITTPSWYSAAASNPCTVCHSGITTHLKVTKGGADQACTACHPGGATNPNKHTDTGNPDVLTIPLPPISWNNLSNSSGSDYNMRTRLGINYSRFGGIHLGGENTSGSTEAEICWGCHDGTTVSEWGYNTKTTPSGYPVVQISTRNDGTSETFNFGWLWNSSYNTKTSDWTTGNWRDEYYWGDATNSNDPGLKRHVVSIHSATFSTTDQVSSVGNNVSTSGTLDFASPTLEARSAIRCSYCHDVHDLNAAQDPFTAGTDSSSGPPFLRGKWVGNPYPPDTPPANTSTRDNDGFTSYPTTGGPTKAVDNNSGSRFYNDMTVGMPRLWGYNGDGVSRVKGGYFIDQNSNDPTSNTAMDSYEEVGGLCALCHGVTVDGMDYYTSDKLWRSITTNGHNNSTIDGTGASRADLFDASRGGASASMAQQRLIGQSQPQLSVGWGSEAQSGRAGDGYNGQDAPVFSTGWYGQAAGDGSANTPTWPGYTDWYVNNTTQQNYHQFTCSKCHSPHATGLPALLVTNCLDVDTANWVASGKTDNANGVGPHSNMAQNCHRNDNATGDSSGWHRLIPDQNDNTNN